MKPNPDPAPNFDRLAGPYRWLEYFSFGPFLWRCRVHFLPQLGDCRRALVLGDGDGRFTAELLRSNAEIAVHAIDLSPTMIQTTERAAKAHASRVSSEIADLRAWSPSLSSRYDVVVSHFFLDCLTSGEVAGLARRLHASLVPGALWVVSDFAVPQTLFGSLIARPLVSALYLAFRWLTGLRIRALPDHAQALTDAGWLVQSEHSWLSGLLVSQLWQRPAIPAYGPSELE
jgi:SAM-dependent methyltransferase